MRFGRLAWVSWPRRPSPHPRHGSPLRSPGACPQAKGDPLRSHVTKSLRLLHVDDTSVDTGHLSPRHSAISARVSPARCQPARWLHLSLHECLCSKRDGWRAGLEDPARTSSQHMASGRFFDTGYFTKMHLVISVLLIQQNRDPVSPFSNMSNVSSSQQLHDDLCAIRPLWRPLLSPRAPEPTPTLKLTFLSGSRGHIAPCHSPRCPSARRACLPRMMRAQTCDGHRFAQIPAVQPEGPSLTGQIAPILCTLARGTYRRGAGYRF